MTNTWNYTIMKLTLWKACKILLMGLILYRALCPSIAFAMEPWELEENSLRMRTKVQVLITADDEPVKKPKPPSFKNKMEYAYNTYIEKALLVSVLACTVGSLVALAYNFYHSWFETGLPGQGMKGLSPPTHQETSHHGHGFRTLDNITNETDAVAVMESVFSMITHNLTNLIAFSAALSNFAWLIILL